MICSAPSVGRSHAAQLRERVLRPRLGQPQADEGGTGARHSFRSCRMEAPSPRVEADPGRRLRRVVPATGVTAGRVRSDAVTRTGAADRTLSTGYRIVATRRQPRAYAADFFRGNFLQTPTENGVADLTCSASTRGNARPESLRCAVRRSWCCSPSSCGTTRRVVGRLRRCAQPAAHHRSSTAPRPSAEPDLVPAPLARGGYLARIGHSRALRRREQRRLSQRRGRRPKPHITPGRPGARYSAVRPSQLLDLRNWYLTLPTGSAGKPTTFNSPTSTATPPLFRVDPSATAWCHRQRRWRDHQEQPLPAFRAARDERDQKAGWSNPTGTHTLSLRQAVTQLPKVKPQVVTAQIHDEESRRDGGPARG